MDKKTIERYQKAANEFIGRYQENKPARLYELIAVFFKRGGTTLDIGCASGRDLGFLKGSGYEVEGLDAVPAFVDYCKEALTDVPIYLEALPKLESIEDNKYDNLLLSAVLMHLPISDLPEAVKSLTRVTKEKGRMVISVRLCRPGEEGLDEVDRENDGRLYTSLNAEKFIRLFEESGNTLKFDEEQPDPTSGKYWYNFVFEKKS